jgi:hypothetical protein
MQAREWMAIVLVVLLVAGIGCGARQPAEPAPAQRYPAGPAQGAPPATPPSPESGTGTASTSGPAEVPIGELSPNPDRTVRVKGVVSNVMGLRLVPPKVVFKIRDVSGTVTAVINERIQLEEGTRLEVVGTYSRVPSPMYTGPGDAPLDAVLVAERYLELP